MLPGAIYQRVLSNIVLPAVEMITNRTVLRRLDFLREAQWWPHDLITAWRAESLASLAQTVYEEVPFYRELFRDAGIHWRHIQQPSDLALLPIVTKDMLRSRDYDSITRRSSFPAHIETSSGSTGAPFRIVEDSQTAAHRQAAFLLSLEWAGWKIGEAHIQTGVVRRDWERWWKDRLLRCHYVSAISLDDASLDAVLHKIETRRVRHLWGYPCALYHLALRAEAVGWNAPALSSVVTWADQLYPRYRQAIERVFGVRVQDTYGCGEGMQIAAQCSHGSYHVHVLDTIAEFAGDQGEPAETGVPARIVLTRLLPGAMPFLRYDIGDIGASGGSSTCPCGRQWEVLHSVEGRLTDVILSPSGRRYTAHFFALCLEEIQSIREYQIVQTAPGAVTVKVVAPAATRGLGHLIAEKLRHLGLGDMEINVEPRHSIPPSAAGKRRWVIGLAEPPAQGAPAGLPTEALAQSSR